VKNELHSFETVATPAAPGLLPGLRGRMALPPRRPNHRRRVSIHRTDRTTKREPLSANIVGGEAGRGGAYLENPKSNIETATPVSHQKPPIRNASDYLRDFGFFAYFRIFHSHHRICKIAHFFGHFSLKMYAISHTILKNASPNGGRALALPTIPTQHPKRAKTPVFPRISHSNVHHSHTFPTGSNDGRA